jgi:FkbM family methyltransferase
MPLHQRLFTLAYRAHEAELELLPRFGRKIHAVNAEWPSRAAIGFDIGAGTGPYGRRLLACCEDVVLVEPNREQAAYLRRAFGTDAHIVEAAAGRTSGGGILTDHQGRGWRRPLAKLSDVPASSSDWQQTCRVETIDAIAGGLGLLSKSGALIAKIDVEGTEMGVLEGMPRLLANRRALLIIEVEASLNPDYSDVFDWLAKAGFACFAYQRGQLVPAGPAQVAAMAGRRPGRFGRLKGYRSNFVFLR